MSSIVLQTPSLWASKISQVGTLNLRLSLITFILITVLPKEKRKSTATLTMVLAASVTLAFTAIRIFNLFVIFEAAIIPTIIMITKIGNYPERATANIFIMVITITASLPMLAFSSVSIGKSKDSLESIKRKLTKKEEDL